MKSSERPVVLLADADPAVGASWRRFLEHDGFSVTLCHDTGAAAEAYARGDIAAIVIREPLPGAPTGVAGTWIGGIDVPVLTIDAEQPISPESIVQRIHVLLDRQHTRLTDNGDLRIDVDSRVVTIGDRSVTVTTRELDLLVFLMRNPGRVHSRGRLLSAVWGWTIGDESTVTVHIRRLREKIEDDPARPKRIVTVWGNGYCYQAPT